MTATVDDAVIAFYTEVEKHVAVPGCPRYCKCGQGFRDSTERAAHAAEITEREDTIYRARGAAAVKVRQEQGS